MMRWSNYWHGQRVEIKIGSRWHLGICIERGGIAKAPLVRLDEQGIAGRPAKLAEIRPVGGWRWVRAKNGLKVSQGAYRG